MSYQYARSLGVDEAWAEVRPYADDGRYFIQAAEEAVNGCSAVACIDSAGADVVVFLLDEEDGSPRRWDAFWRLCAFATFRCETELRKSKH